MSKNIYCYYCFHNYLLGDVSYTDILNLDFNDGGPCGQCQQSWSVKNENLCKCGYMWYKLYTSTEASVFKHTCDGMSTYFFLVTGEPLIRPNSNNISLTSFRVNNTADTVYCRDST